MSSPPFDFAAFPTLETERLVLREVVTPDDTDALFRLRGDYQVTRLNIGPAYTRIKQAEDLAAHIRRAYRARREIWWGVTVKPDPTLIGLCILYHLQPRPEARAMLGYELARASWGRGLMTEAMRTVLAWGFTELGLDRVEADADATNDRSLQSLQRAGFRQTGTREGARYVEGERHDLLLFALTCAEWSTAVNAPAL
jgi:ribosomal-protein-alanine N-acetyltransferase